MKRSAPRRRILWLMCKLVILLVALCSFLGYVRPFSGTASPASVPTDQAVETHRLGNSILGSMQDLSDLEGNNETCTDLWSRLDLSKIKSSNYTASASQMPYFMLGKPDFYGEDAEQCVTYEDRFFRYTDQVLGINYRAARINIDPYHPNDYHPLFGFRQSPKMNRKDWEVKMKEHYRLINTRTDVDGMSLRVPNWASLIEGCGRPPMPAVRKGDRTALVLRYGEGAIWTEDDILTTRAMIAELILARPEAGWGLIIMIQVADDSTALISSEKQREVLTTMMPKEFWPFAHFWNTNTGRLLFPGFTVKGKSLWDRYSYKRDCLMAEQILLSFPQFSDRFDYVQNWESDLRFVGDFRTLFDSMDRYAKAEPLDPSMRRYEHFYVPNSTRSRLDFKASDSRLRDQPRGQAADLITLSPLWDASTDPVWKKAVDPINYDPKGRFPMSTMAIYKMSTRLIRAYNTAMVKHGKSMFCEAWPSTLVVDSHLPPSTNRTFETQQEIDDMGGPLKGVFAPHPIRLDKNTTVQYLEEQLFPDSANRKIMEHDSFNCVAPNKRSAFYHPWRFSGSCERPYLIHPVKNTWY